MLCEFKAQGFRAEKFLVDVDHLLAWCKHRS
jgi:hypothetical protein